MPLRDCRKQLDSGPVRKLESQRQTVGAYYSRGVVEEVYLADCEFIIPRKVRDFTPMFLPSCPPPLPLHPFRHLIRTCKAALEESAVIEEEH